MSWHFARAFKVVEDKRWLTDDARFLSRNPPLNLIAFNVSLPILSKFGAMFRASPKTNGKLSDLLALSSTRVSSETLTVLMKTDTARTMTTALADISTPIRKPEKKGDDVTDGIPEGRGYSSCHRRVLDTTIIGMSFTSCFRSRKASRENRRPAVAA
jgi:hypothetical protein